MFMAERVGFEPTERFPVHSISSAASSTTPAPLQDQPQKGTKFFSLCLLWLKLLAERVGFEPTVGVNPLRFSRPVH
jgi:hypothetical protein